MPKLLVMVSMVNRMPAPLIGKEMNTLWETFIFIVTINHPMDRRLQLKQLLISYWNALLNLKRASPHLKAIMLFPRMRLRAKTVNLLLMNKVIFLSLIHLLLNREVEYI